MFDLPDLFACLIGGYLIGSIPFGLILTRLAGAGDIRQIGSGNIGATNVLRTGRKGLAVATLLLDGAKGAVALLSVAGLSDNGRIVLLSCFAAFVGHIYPIWLKFRGGKGVATALGLLWAAMPGVGALACATWLGMAFLFRYSSLAALVALGTAPIIAYGFGHHHGAVLAAAMAALSWWRHRDNIRRLLRGEESKINLRKKTESPAK